MSRKTVQGKQITAEFPALKTFLKELEVLLKECPTMKFNDYGDCQEGTYERTCDDEGYCDMPFQYIGKCVDYKKGYSGNFMFSFGEEDINIGRELFGGTILWTYIALPAFTVEHIRGSGPPYERVHATLTGLDFKLPWVTDGESGQIYEDEEGNSILVEALPTTSSTEGCKLHVLDLKKLEGLLTTHLKTVLQELDTA